jgi:hypothetical protein
MIFSLPLRAEMNKTQEKRGKCEIDSQQQKFHRADCTRLLFHGVLYGGRKFFFLFRVEADLFFPTDCNYVPIKKTKGEYFISVPSVLIQHFHFVPFSMTIFLFAVLGDLKALIKSKHVDIYP